LAKQKKGGKERKEWEGEKEIGGGNLAWVLIEGKI